MIRKRDPISAIITGDIAMKKIFIENLHIGLFIFFLISTSFADNINWVVNWKIQKADSLATGTFSQNDVLINAVYCGHFSRISSASYWGEGNPPPYTGNEVVDNAPTSGITLSDVSALTSGYANTLTFSSPIKNPLFALYSVGNSGSGVPYEFDQSFTLLSEGSGVWGYGNFFANGDTITGYESNGVIQFNGMVSSIAWNNPVAENHHGFSIGCIDSVTLSIKNEIRQTPESFILNQNYPNPFNPTTTINFSIPKQTFVELTIMDVLGKKIKTLVNKDLSSGTYQFKFNGSQLASGIYIYMLKTKEYTSIKKMLLIQ